MAYSGSYTQERPQYKRGVASIFMPQCHGQLNIEQVSIHSRKSHE